jgi:beta-galactosidase/beta-glucuronidase
LPSNAREILVPGSYNEVFPGAAARDHVGDAWYETNIRVPVAWTGERIVLHFGSATHRAGVWVNGTEIAEHEGGYTPFEVDVSDLVEPGADNSSGIRCVDGNKKGVFTGDRRPKAVTAHLRRRWGGSS